MTILAIASKIHMYKVIFELIHTEGEHFLKFFLVSSYLWKLLGETPSSSIIVVC